MDTNPKTKIALALAGMVLDAGSMDEVAEYVCMFNEVLAYERRGCYYCGGSGHRAEHCGTHVRLSTLTFGDRAVNSLRAGIS